MGVVVGLKEKSLVNKVVEHTQIESRGPDLGALVELPLLDNNLYSSI